MKKYAITIFSSVLIGFFADAQSNIGFGVKGGLNLTFFNVAEADFGSFTEVETSYYGGLFADFGLDEDFSIQTELLYIGLNDFKFINTPIYIKYEVVDNLYLLVGPSLNYFFDFYSNKFKVRADLSTLYNITSFFDIHLKYTLGFEEFAPNGLFLGVGYKF
ncbi:MAG TPA: hypothetical protein VJ945_06725 [Flavobacteriaceae bacterium]|nr:hypothetical protein [Flavobacteriaceae bacterium]